MINRVGAVTGASELTIALKHLQHLEPPGIGARNLAECLSLQLEALPADTPYRNDALTTVRNHLDLLAGRDFAKLKKLLRCNDDTLRGAQALITSLNPRPGARFSKNEARFIIPDVIVRKLKGLWRVSLNPDAMPRLRINRLYAEHGQRARFYVVYIQEAHPVDLWQVSSNVEDGVLFTSPQSDAERSEVAGTCVLRLAIKLPALVDGLDNRVERAYTGWPDRLYVIGTDGRIRYKSAAGPFGFSTTDLERALLAELN